MGDKSGIEWTDATWNPTTGCDQVSPGCDNCYALTLAARLKGMGVAAYQNDGDPRTSGPGFKLTLHPDRLDQPIRWQRPRRVFVNSMSDLFHHDVPTDFIVDVWTTMEKAQQHIFQILTKRPQRMGRVVSRDLLDEPLSNVWLGTSIENNKYAFRARFLRETPAAIRFISAEPLLGPLDQLDLQGIDWVIAGGESGPGARPMHPDWARDLRDRCVAAGVAFFFKQWGNHIVEEQAPEDILLPGECWFLLGDPGPCFYRVGKKAAGRELDGRTWDEYPSPTLVES
jgi:protein gp37